MITLRLFNQQLSMRFEQRALLYSILLFGLLLIALLTSTLTGSYQLSLSDTLYTLFRQNQHVTDTQAFLIIWEFRLPRSLAAALSGTLFAISGALLQNMTRNPLADPSLVGISHGAALAVVILTILFPNYIDTWREVAAFLGAVCIAILIQCLRGEESHPLKFILLGIGVAALVSAIIATLLTYGNLQAAMSALLWLAGSVHVTSWPDITLLGGVLFIIGGLSLIQARTMSVISLGNDVAIGLGVSMKKQMIMQLSLSVGAAAIATAVVGPLGFVGLLAPHLARKIIKSGPANHLLLTALVGATLVLTADIIGKSLFSPTQLAAGLVTSLVGAPLFAYLLMKKPS